MILPTNGKVAIFDDKYDDVKKLLGSLSQQKIPYFYFQDEGGDDLPDTPIKNIRLVFLDLELVTDNKATEQTIVSYIAGRLEKVLEPKTSYVLIYWSTKLNKFKHAIDNAFESTLSNYKPILNISLDKIQALRSSDPIKFIVDEIKSKAEDFQVLKVFSFWENMVNDSTGSLINAFTNFIVKDDQWDDTAKFILYKLAYAYGGKEINNLSEIEQIKNSYYTLNHTLIDSIENIVSYKIDSQKEQFSDVISSNFHGEDIFSSLINNKLLISEKTFTANIPGCIFFIDEEIDKDKNKIKSDLENTKNNTKIPEEKKDLILKKLNDKAEQNNREITFRHSAFIKNYNVMLNSLFGNEEDRKMFQEVLKHSIKIELNISPICDYAQSKMPCCRLLPGFLIPNNYASLLLKNNAFNYISDPKINYHGTDYLLVFDFRFLHSISESILKKKKSSFKLRQQLLGDIQLKLGNHVNRAGVLYL